MRLFVRLAVLPKFLMSAAEPMLTARRGEALDFTQVPVDRTMPLFAPPLPHPTEAKLHPRVAERVAAFRAKAEKRRAAAEQRADYRESAEYQTAMQLLAGEMGAGWRLPELRAKMSDGSATALSEG